MMDFIQNAFHLAMAGISGNWESVLITFLGTLAFLKSDVLAKFIVNTIKAIPFKRVRIYLLIKANKVAKAIDKEIPDDIKAD